MPILPYAIAMTLSPNTAINHVDSSPPEDSGSEAGFAASGS